MIRLHGLRKRDLSYADVSREIIKEKSLVLHILLDL